MLSWPAQTGHFLNDRHSFPTVQEAGRSRSESAGQLPVRPTPGFANCWPPSCCPLLGPFLRVPLWTERERALWGLFSRGPGCMTPSNPHHVLKLLPSTSTLGVKVQHTNSGETPRASWRDCAPPFRRRKSHCHCSAPGPACPHPGGEGARAGCSEATSGVRAGPTEQPWGSPAPSLAGRRPAPAPPARPREHWPNPRSCCGDPWDPLPSGLIRQGAGVTCCAGTRQARAADPVSPLAASPHGR